MDNNQLLSLAREFETPLYVFDEDEFARRLALVRSAFGTKVGLCYSIKANPFLLKCLPQTLDHLEVCSPGELTVCENAGVDLTTIVFSGVNKTLKSVKRAMDDNVYIFTIESILHAEYIQKAAAERNKKVPVLLRLTSDNQFGMDEEDLVRIVSERDKYPNLIFSGLHYFSGTLKKRTTLIGRELDKLDGLIRRIWEETGLSLTKIEYGPGLWIDYFGENPDEAEETLLLETAPLIRTMGEKYDLTVEMGRFFAAPCGSYLTTVMDTKTNCGFRYAIVDGGLHQMNYDGQMKGTQVPDMRRLTGGEGEQEDWCVCGSLCTPNDVLVRRVSTPPIERGDVLAFCRTGAYSINEGFAFLLSRDLPAVVICRDGQPPHVAREHVGLDPMNTPV
ncbi:MAG: alanine racemase [Oscillospiraceae bacterium]|nr:alanine racemase [Oscillospiraceae bacterium]